MSMSSSITSINVLVRHLQHLMYLYLTVCMCTLSSLHMSKPSQQSVLSAFTSKTSL